ncbi:hypothetical protein VL762_12470 [Flavobacterium psychrophilum]|nr:hypothetical protein [Flavobacterium psychrophilum]
MKAIHNSIASLLYQHRVGNYKLKYNFESNSQQKGTATRNNGSW